MTITPVGIASRPALTPLAESFYEQLRPLQFAESETGYALAHYIAALSTLLDPINEIAEDDEAGHVGWQIGADPELCPDWLLGWLAMWAGVPPAQRTEEETRHLIAHSPAQIRGTRQAMIASVQELLTGGQHVYFVERDGGPYNLTMYVFQTEAPETDWREISNEWFNPSAETNTDYVTAYGASLTRSPDEAAPGAGAASFRLQCNQTYMGGPMGIFRDFAVHAGETVSLAASFLAATVGRQCFAELNWFGPGTLGTTPQGGGTATKIGQSRGIIRTDSTGDWMRSIVVGEVPAGATQCRAAAEVGGPANGMNEVHFIDAIRYSPNGEDAGEYADGDTPGWEWTGAAHGSPAKRIPTNLVESAARSMKPGGIVLNFEVRPGQFYLHLPPKFDSYAELTAGYSDYEEMRSDQPF